MLLANGKGGFTGVFEDKYMTMQMKKSKLQNLIFPWLDVFAISAWGILILKYWLTGKLYLLIHPDYFWLAIAGALGLLAVSAWRAWFLVKSIRRRRSGDRFLAVQSSQHITFFPPGWSSILLLSTAILGLVFTPRVFASETALQRGIADSLTVTRSQPQSFRIAKPPEKRSLIDWVRTLTVYPEPDAYTGQKVNIQGFVIHPKELPDQYLLLSRFIITCCAADAYPVGLPVKLTTSRNTYKPDSWLEVQGEMITETLDGKRQLTIQSTSIKPVLEPKNPYDY